MASELEQKIAAALSNPKNMGEMEAPDAVGTVGNAGCGEMLRLWIKYREEQGKRIIDRATFQSFGCETAIAVASLATELIRGKTPQEALALSGEDLAGELGPLPPMKIHCAQLVEGALRSALEPELKAQQPVKAEPANAPSLLDRFSANQESKARIVFLKESERGNA